MLIPGAVVLHVAPERVLGNRLRSIPGAEYHGGDLTAEFGPERIDVTDLQFPDRSVDILVCNHVLEHVPDDREAMDEIHRVLKPDGWALLLVPDLEGDSVSQTTDEDPSITDPAERLRRFGQDDHVRRYGWDYLDRLREAGFEPEVIRPESQFGTAAVERYRLAKHGAVEPLIFCRPAAGSDAERVE
jgi:SAM-dependent methyltransferase